MQIQNLHDQHELSFSDVQNSRNFRCPTNCRCSPIMLARHWSFCFWAVMYPQKMRQAPKNRGLWADCWHQHLGSNTGRFFFVVGWKMFEVCYRSTIETLGWYHWWFDFLTFWLFLAWNQAVLGLGVSVWAMTRGFIASICQTWSSRTGQVCWGSSHDLAKWRIEHWMPPILGPVCDESWNFWCLPKANISRVS